MMPLCKCGCENSVTWSINKKDWNVYLKGHNNRGKVFSEETRKKLSKAQKKSSHFHIYNKTKAHSIKASESNRTRTVTEKTKRKIAKSLIGSKHTEETKLKMKISHIDRNNEGSNNDNWKGGVSQYSQNWIKLSKEIKKRDNCICQTCKNKSQLQVHHIDFDKKNDKPSNLITLCKSCHSKLHPKGFVK